MSSMDKGSAIDENNKRKPESILLYNHNKVRVDMIDSMARQMTCKSGTIR